MNAAFDAHAEQYDRHRALPHGVPEAIRAAVLRAVDAAPRPRVLDLGAGTGRIGRPFVAADDDYVGADLSIAMLREFQRHADARLIQADGQSLPFADGAFDAVMLIQVFGGLRAWRRFLGEARRVLTPQGTLVLGRTAAPDGIDARMKRRLALLLDELGVVHSPVNTRSEAQQWLASAASNVTQLTAANWKAARTPRGFLERHRSGAQFAALPETVRDEAMRKLASWAADIFGSLDAPHSEDHSFELQLYRFA